jgi:hypothetical protein
MLLQHPRGGVVPLVAVLLSVIAMALDKMLADFARSAIAFVG